MSGSWLTDGTATVQTLGKGPLGCEHLHLASGNVVGCGVAENVVESFFFGDVASCFANYQTQFGFVVAGSILGALGDVDGSWVRPTQG